MITFTTANYEKDATTGQYVNKGNIKYEIFFNPDSDYILFTRNGIVKSVKVCEDHNGFRYAIKKTKINACGGASGLYDFLYKEVSNDKTGGFALIVINKVFDYMK